MPAFDQSNSSDFLAGSNNSSNALAFRIFRVDNHALNSVNHFKRTVLAALQRLSGLAPAAIENGIRSRNTRRSRCILTSHDADQHIDGRSGVATCDRSYLGQGFGHTDAFSSSERSTGVPTFHFAAHYEFDLWHRQESEKC
jgi:hypothetical protein